MKVPRTPSGCGQRTSARRRQAVSVESVQAQLQRILSSNSFALSERQKRFLSFAVQEVIEGRGTQLKEHRIGVEVLERTASYDPRLDPIVRVQAHLLRSRLQAYYQTEGREDPILIEFPKGTYVPVFRQREAKVPQPGRTRLRQRSPEEWRTIAVLPFADLSPEKDQGYFCEGMSDELVSTLAHMEGLRVVFRAPDFQSGGTPDVLGSGRRLGAGTVLTGSVRKAGERIRVTAQLRDVADGCHLWAEIYDREMKDVFAIQNEVSRAIANALRVALVERHEAQFLRRHTKSPEAYNLYLKGRYYQDRWRSGWGLEKTIEYLKQAIAEDPEYARAYAALAESYSLAVFYGILPPRDVMPAARAAATRALELDEGLAAAHTALGVVQSIYDWDWAGAEEQFNRALELEPSNANTLYWHAHYLELMGRLEEAIAEKRRTCELDPLSVLIRLNSAIALYLNGNYLESIEQSRRTIELDPQFAGGYWGLGLAYERQSNYQEAIQALEKAAELSGSSPWVTGALGRCYALAGRRDEAARLLDELKELSSRRYVSSVSMALIHIGLGENDRAFEGLEEAYMQRDVRLIYLNVNPAYETIRSDPRFQDLVERVGLAKN